MVIMVFLEDCMYFSLQTDFYFIIKIRILVRIVILGSFIILFVWLMNNLGIMVIMVILGRLFLFISSDWFLFDKEAQNYGKIGNIWKFDYLVDIVAEQPWIIGNFGTIVKFVHIFMFRLCEDKERHEKKLNIRLRQT